MAESRPAQAPAAKPRAAPASAEMQRDRSATRVIGRDAELARGDQFLDALSVGPASFLVEGEPGIGKTTVWSEICARAEARGDLVLKSRPANAEADLPFVGLIDLLGGHVDEVLPDLPDPQRRALEIALLRVDARADEAGALAVSAGFLSILRSLAERGPLVLAIDDLQWLDGPTLGVLRYVLRRLDHLRVGFLAAVRVPSALDPSARVPVLGVVLDGIRLDPLPMASLYQLIHDQLGISLPRAALLQVEGASAGNPFLALEIARSTVRGGSLLTIEAMPLPDDVLALVAARFEGLPAQTRDALLRASALARPTTALVAARDLEPAVDAQIVAIDADGRVRFGHPLFARAAYAAAAPSARSRLHAELSGQVEDPDERALHAALASTERDEVVAVQLHEAAERARRRGAPAFAAELEERAAERTPLDRSDQILERSIRAAEHHERAGDVERAKATAEQVLATEPPPLVRSRARQLLAEIAFGASFPDAIRNLELALEDAAGDQAREAALERDLAFARLAVNDLTRALQHARRAEALARAVGSEGLEAEAIGARVYCETLLTDRLDRNAVRVALRLEDPAREATVQVRPSQSVAVVNMLLGRLEEARTTFLELRTGILESGEEHELPFALGILGFIELLRGDIDAANAFADDTERTATATGSETLRAFGLAIRALIDAYAGGDVLVHQRAAEALAIFARVGWQVGSLYALKAIAFHAMSRDRWADVLETFEPVTGALGVSVGFGGTSFIAGDIAESMIALGDLAGAARIVDGVEAAARSLDAPWAAVVGARNRALLESALGDHGAADAAIHRAIEAQAALPIPFERARTLLANAHVLRRQRQKGAAREAVQAARGLFDDLRMPLWVAKADAEMARLGGRRAGRTDLTETERRVAELAASGLTNRQIGAQAFLGHRTVEDVLARVYGKLGIHSRAELGAWVAREKSSRT